MKKPLYYILFNRHGSVINVALLILILIFLVGIGLHKISTTDIKIANNLKTKTSTFYEAEAGLDNVGVMIEQNMLCAPYGFKDTPTATDGLPVGEEIIDNYFYFKDVGFAISNLRREAHIPFDSEDINDNGILDAGEDLNGNGALDTTPAFDFYYPLNLNEPHTKIKIGGVARYTKGSAIQMSAGYEGLGKGAASGGFTYLFDVYAQRIGSNNSSALHFMQWRYKPTPGDCNYDL